MSEDKPTDAEEVLSEFQKNSEEQEKPVEISLESEPKPEIESPTPTEPEQTPSSSPEPQESTPAPELSTKESKSEKEEDSSRVRNVIFVGLKPIMTYVTATLTQLSSEPTVTIKARGKRITQAVDVSQMIVKRMNTVGYIVSDVRISSDSLTSQDGKMRNVSTMEIDITKT
ncbi:MAG: DNA-binding protein [Nitrosopumilaceae archaeon]|jgi:DNA-binding protein|nr:MAG: DNA/RNA-binding protein Alba [Nitrosopumilales archaeon]